MGNDNWSSTDGMVKWYHHFDSDLVQGNLANGAEAFLSLGMCPEETLTCTMSSVQERLLQ